MAGPIRSGVARLVGSVEFVLFWSDIIGAAGLARRNQARSAKVRLVKIGYDWVRWSTAGPIRCGVARFS
jgi:hypothetical protein